MLKAMLKAMLERCGGLERLDAAIYELLAHVRSRVTGGLRYNRFQIGFWSDGELRIHCSTCNKNRAFAFGHERERPFKNMVQCPAGHLFSKQHEKARDAAIAQDAPPPAADHRAHRSCARR